MLDQICQPLAALQGQERKTCLQRWDASSFSPNMFITSSGYALMFYLFKGRAESGL